VLACIAAGDWSIRQVLTVRKELGYSVLIIKHRCGDIRKMMINAQIEQRFGMIAPFEQKLSRDLFLKISTVQEPGLHQDGSQSL
jgi:hypothetical protein